MKLPTEGELIELENWLYSQRHLTWTAPLSASCAVERIETLITLARDPSAMLRTALESEALNWEKAQPPRNAEPEPVPSVQPKPSKNPPSGWKKRKHL
jgi:hypothetical protein